MTPLDLGESPPWRAQKKPLSAAEYGRHDAVLQVVADDGAAAAPHGDLFAAAAKRRGESGAPALITLPGGTAVCRLRWDAAAETFARLQKAREALTALLALSPATLALDARAGGGAAADVLHAALVGAARLPGAAKKPPPAVTLAGADGRDGAAAFAAAAAEANTLARALTQAPPNLLTPASFAAAARRLAKREGLSVVSYSAARLKRLGAGAILAVGRASAENPPSIIRLRYQPAGGGGRRVAFVGKGICFDTGGVNLKPARHMRGMGKDMAGAAAALAIVVAAARLRLPVGADAWLALAENAIGPEAYRPDEVITALNGTRIEIVHTDAEGRLALADALTLASADKPAAAISLATLTGTMHVALGDRMSGFFGEDAAWRDRAAAAALASGERLCWFPMPADYREALKSDVADVLQCAEEGEADHILAALFLRRFVGDKSAWLHVDLSAASRKGGLGAAPGPTTGFGVAWGLELLRGLARDWPG